MIARLMCFGMALVAFPVLAQTPVKFSIDWSFQGYHGGFVQAADLGFYQKQGLAVTMERGFGVTDTIAKVASGTYDIGFADINALVEFNALHPDNRVIGVFQIYDRTMAAIMALRKSGIRAPSDLVGRSIAGAQADVARLLFPAFAKANNIDPAKVKWNIYAPNLRDSMVVQGRDDAVSGYTITSIFNLVGAGVPQDQIVTLSYADLGVDVYGSSLLVRQGWAGEHADTIRKFIVATMQGLNSAITDRPSAIADVVKRDRLLDPVVERARLDMVIDTAFVTPFIKAHGWGTLDPARVQATIDLNAAAYGLATPPTQAELVSTDYLPDASSRRLP